MAAQDISSPPSPVTREIPLTQDYVALVDAEDYEYLSQWKWRAKIEKNTVYAARDAYTANGKRSHIRMHRLIMSAPKGMEVDHRDGDGLNNRRNNLRVCTKAQNLTNQRPQKGTSSRFKGVYRNKRDRQWQAYIKVNGKRKHLGCFASEVEAAKAYNNAAIQFHGEFAWLNDIESKPAAA
jgi:hypothetical protein